MKELHALSVCVVFKSQSVGSFVSRQEQHDFVVCCVRSPILLSLLIFHNRGPSCTILLLVRSRFYSRGSKQHRLTKMFHD